MSSFLQGLKFWTWAFVAVASCAFMAYAASGMGSLASVSGWSQLSSTAWNDVVAHVNFLAKPPIAQISATSSTTIPHGALTKIALPTVWTMRGFTTSDSKLFATSPGYYQCFWAVDYGNNTVASSIHHAYITVNSTTSFAYDYLQSTGAWSYVKVSTTWAVYLNGTTDYVELYGWQNTGTPRTTSTGGGSFVRCQYLWAQ